ncbi:MAG: GMC family oxidoreductase [Sediminicola sp.]
MHVDARLLEDQSLIEGDICIIGAGAAGISMALDWLDTPYKVILLEGGGFEYEDEIQDSYDGQVTGQKYYPLKSSRLHYFGGTTGHWGGMCSPMDPVDFTEREWVPHSGWPINRKDLDPYYIKAHKCLQLGPFNYDYGYWSKELPNLRSFPMDEEVMWNKMWQYSVARFGKIYKDALITSKNIYLYTYAKATRLESTSQGEHITGVRITNLGGKTQLVKAKKVILACGAIQNARLLLVSNNNAPKGLGNGHDLVGRYFMEHLEVPSAEFWLTEPFPTDLYSWTFGKTKASAELAFTEKTQKKYQILNGTASLVPLHIGRRQKPKLDTWVDENPKVAMKNMMQEWENAENRAEKENKGAISRAYQLDTRIEQAPNHNSRVSLGKEKDAFGMLRADLHWELTPLDKRSIRKMYEIIALQMGISNVGRIRLLPFLRDEADDGFPDTVNGGWHHMGTTRMAEDPKMGVVDAHCRVHGIDNLYVAGSGCFATSGAPNPTLTLVALALRLSDHIKELMAKRSL